MIERPYRTAALAALLLLCCLALSATCRLLRARRGRRARAGHWRCAPERQAPRRRRFGSRGPPPSGKDLTGPPPSSTPNKQDRSDILGNVPLGDPAVRAEMLKELYTQLRSARNAKDGRADRRGDRGDLAPLGQRHRRSAHDPRRYFRAAADLDLALQVLDAVTELAPEHGEGLASARHRACDAERYRAGDRRSQARARHGAQPL